MAHKYKFTFAADVPSEVRAQFHPDFIEAGPVTINAAIHDVQRRLGPEYEIIEDPEDYKLLVRKSTKPRKAA